MGSRIMHLAIGKLIKNELNYGDRFLLGNLLPDAHEKSHEAKALSHFKLREVDWERRRFLDYKRFASKYKEILLDEVYLGYYCHLISDEIWLGDIFTKYIPSENEIERNKSLEKYYRDFTRLNYVLIQKYNITNDVTFYYGESVESIEEINKKLLRIILEELEIDFLGRDIGCLDLEILRIEDIINYIEKCVRVAINNIKELKLLA